MIKRRNVEMYTQAHQMYAEGDCEQSTTKHEIYYFILNEGYIASNIELWFDEMMQVHKFYCDLKKR